jgi:hypothetical protein
MAGFSSSPTPPPPPPPPPVRSDAEVQEAALQERLRQARVRGRSANILTGGEGAAIFSDGRASAPARTGTG